MSMPDKLGFVGCVVSAVMWVEKADCAPTLKYVGVIFWVLFAVGIVVHGLRTPHPRPSRLLRPSRFGPH